MPSWTIQSDRKKVYIYSAVVGALGALLIYSARHSEVATSNTKMGHLAGVLMVVFSLALFIFFEDTRIEVHEGLRQLWFLKKSPMQVRRYQLSFDDVESVRVVRIGRRFRGQTYHLIIHLKNGKKERPGRFSFNAEEINFEAARLSKATGCDFFPS